jgi:hypothetical protein
MAYTVKQGDTLWDLSRKSGVPLQELLRQVPESVRKDPRKLMPGMQLNIPGMDQAAPGMTRGPVGTGMTSAQAADRAAQLGAPLMRGPRPGDQTAAQREQGFAQTRDRIGGVMNAPIEAVAGSGMGPGAVRGLQGMYGAARAFPTKGLEAIGAPFEAGLHYLGNKLGARQAAKQEDQRLTQHFQDMASNAEGRRIAGPPGYEPLLPGQQTVQRMVREGRGGDIPMQFDVNRYAQSNPNATLESLYRLGQGTSPDLNYFP